MNPLSDREEDLAGEQAKPLDHPSYFSGLKQLHEEELLCDTTIVAKGERFPCHRILLAAINPYFRAMFSNSFRESQDGEVLLQDMDPSIIQTVVQYYYTEEIELTPEIAEDLYEAASRLQILPLLESCSSYLLEHLCPENCLSIYQLGYSHNDPALFQEAKSLVHAHFKRLSQEAPTFLDLNPSTLESILASDNLLVSSELLVYRAAWRWVQAQSALRLPFLARLLAQVRFPLLTPEELRQVQTELLQRPKELRPRWRRLNRQERLAQCGGLRRGMFNTCIVCVDLFNLEGPELRTKDFQVGCYDPQAGLWEKLPLLERLYCARCVALRDRLFVTGGVHTDDTYSDMLHEYSPLRGRWSRLAPMSVARASHGFLTWGGRLFAVGGWRNFEDYLDSAESYDLTERRWARIARLPLPLSHFGRRCWRFYLVGRRQKQGAGNDHARCSSTRWAPISGAKPSSAAGVTGGRRAGERRIYARRGGYFLADAAAPPVHARPSAGAGRAALHPTLLFPGCWTGCGPRDRVPPLPVELAGAGVVRWKQRIYVLGGENVALGRRAVGENEEEYYNTVYYWEQGAPRWIRCQERLPFANWGVSGFGCAAVKLPKKPILELFRKTAVALTGLEGSAC
ncbi:hypothetical protein E2320_006128 [Naja naja]|nr:hypothetical protein E2320_006128 [Naja naja]